jgi:hypothetical protein
MTVSITTLVTSVVMLILSSFIYSYAECMFVLFFERYYNICGEGWSLTELGPIL